MKHFITIILSLILSLTTAHAQSVGDKLYNQGIALQQNKSSKSKQYQAIDKFKSAKVAYDSSAKKSQCDAAIARSNSIIESLDRNNNDNNKDNKRRKDKKDKKETKVETVKTTLDVSIDRLMFKSSSKPGEIKVTTNNPQWKVDVVEYSSATKFVTVQKNEDNDGFFIYCNDNKTHNKRTARIRVTAGALVRDVHIEQFGADIQFYVENSTVEFKKKGGKKSLYIYSSYNQKYDDNNGKNWHVVSKPDWADIISGDKKNESLLKKLENAVNGISNTPDINNSLQTSVVNFIMVAIPKDSPDYKTGRKGEVILESGDKQLRILILQQ